MASARRGGVLLFGNRVGNANIPMLTIISIADISTKPETSNRVWRENPERSLRNLRVFKRPKRYCFYIAKNSFYYFFVTLIDYRRCVTSCSHRVFIIAKIVYFDYIKFYRSSFRTAFETLVNLPSHQAPTHLGSVGVICGFLDKSA